MNGWRHCPAISKRPCARGWGARAAIVRQGSIIWLVFQEEAPRRAEDVQSEAAAVYNRGHQAILDRGVYLPPSGYEVMFISLAHTAEMLDKAASVIAASIGWETTPAVMFSVGVRPFNLAITKIDLREKA